MPEPLGYKTTLPQKLKNEPYIPSDEDIMRMGGWETDYVMKGVYKHAMEDKNKKAQREAARRLGDSLFN